MFINDLLTKVSRWILKDELDKLNNEKLHAFYLGIKDEKDSRRARTIRDASAVSEIIGKRISGVIFKKRNDAKYQGNPNIMMHLLFDDNTSYELYTTESDVFVPTSGIRRWSLEDVRRYMAEYNDTIFEAYIDNATGKIIKTV